MRVDVSVGLEVYTPAAVFSVISAVYLASENTGVLSLMSSTVMVKACVSVSPAESVTVRLSPVSDVTPLTPSRLMFSCRNISPVWASMLKK